MVRRSPSATCIRDGCNRPARPGQTVCTEDHHLTVLQREIQRLNSTRGPGLEGLLARFPELRHLLENIAALADRADPLKASQTAVTARSRGHGQDDGIVVLGEHIARPGYSASVKSDEGVLGAALSMVADAVRKTNRMLDPSESGGKGSDPRPRCGRSACHGRNTRQPVGIKWCGFCALPMSGREPSDSVERPVSLRLVADA